MSYGVSSWTEKKIICSVLTVEQFPYIDFESATYLNREQINPHDSEQPPHFRKMIKLHDVYPAYSGSAGLQAPSTLDGSYYDMLTEEQLLVRDKDQVVLKWFQAKKDKEEDYRKMALDYFSRRFWREWRDAVESDDQTTTAAGTIVGDDEYPQTPFRGGFIANYALGPNTAPDPDDDIPTKERATPREPEPKMLMIHQLWLWKLCDSM